MPTSSRPTRPPSADARPDWRWNAGTLAVAQALGGANPAIVVSLGGLVGGSLVKEPALATVPVSLLQLGLAAGTLPAALLMARLGRRGGYLVGATVGVLAGSIAATGVAAGSFLVFCIGTGLAGLYSAFVNSYRFAAVDDVHPAERPRAISWVMTGGIAGGVIGPQTVIWTRDLVPNAPFAGGFLGQATLALISIAVLAALRPGPAPARREGAPAGRPLLQILRQRSFVLAALAGLISYGLMSLMMTAAPVAMVVECGLSVDAATLGIQWHILAMFGPSFVTGRLIERFGKLAVTLSGLALIGLAALVGLAGRDMAHFWAALVLIGLGWNFGFIGATAMVTDSYRPEERAKVQGANDFLVFGTVAITSFSSGGLLAFGGWALVNWLALPTVAVAAAVLALSSRSAPRPSAARP